jgi:RHS repeat-associated protein
VRPELLLANNGAYIEKLMTSALPYLSHLWSVDVPVRPAHLLPASSKALLGLTPPAEGRIESVSASSVWADCINVEGHAVDAQLIVYIYVDAIQVGTTSVQGGSYFIYDISAHVNDGGNHAISAWYYDSNWNWLEAGSTSVSGCFPNYDFDTPRLEPFNETGDVGVNPGSQNINWSVPLVGLPGRGLDLDLLLTYNSLVWTKSADGAAIMYDTDHGFPSPGFRLRFPIMQPLFFNPAVGVSSYMLVTSTGARIELRQVSSNTYESADSSYIKMVHQGASGATVWLKDGTQMSFSSSVNDELRCSKIKDRNGNFISVTYTAQGNISTVTDTLDRQVVFNYDTNHRLLSISQDRTGLVDTLVTFGYDNASFSPSFPGFNVLAPTTATIPVLTQVGFADGRRYNFEYTTLGQVNKIRRHEADNRLLSYVRYNLWTGPQSDCPRFNEERIWAENWNNNQEALTTYSGNVTTGLSQITTPDQVIHKQFYHTSGWREGLVEKTETWWGGVKRKWTEMYWTQDNEALSYQVNPRPNDVRAIDEAGNQRRVTIAYDLYGLPSNVREYSGASVVRRRETQYRFDAAFVDRHILGVVWMELVYEGESTLRSKLNYHHDWTDPDSWNGQTPLTGHDTTNYGSSFVWGRANVTGIRRYNLQAPTDDNQAVWVQRFGYNTAGSPFRMKDGLNHAITISYTDSFSDGNSRGTLAHATSVTDADNFVSTFKYHYDIGALTRRQDPKGAVATSEYDNVGRLQRITNQFTTGYTRWEYPLTGEIKTFTKVDANQLETVSVQYTDGAGRLRAVISNLPGSSGLWRASRSFYDIMGRLKEQTNPTEVTSTWVPAGDDAAGWVVTQQTYDWQGRPRVTTNQDGSTRELSYTGCGCAGGDVVTLRDERGRRRKFYNDVLGRLVKVEELNWDTSVYSTTTFTYNARDQLTQSNQAGQLRTFTYDNHGRLLTRTTPEQGTTTYGYNADDTVQTITDARNAVMTFGYNPRKLVTGITFSVPSVVAATPNVTFGYDAAGNRTSMSSSESTVTYVYDTASRLTSEARTFNGLSGSFTLSYAYNQLDQLTEITHHGNVKVGYTYNHAGEVTGVTGQGYAGVTSYASGMTYRAFGGLKQMNYANGRNLSLSYNNRMFLTQWSIPNVMRMQYLYEGGNGGRVEFARNQDDETLDRYFAYDQVGRLIVSRSGNEARLAIGEQVPLLYNGPYSHGYQYDKWGNITYREGWGGANPSFTASYTNNKRDGMTYDVTGNLTNDGGQSFTYDATGQQATASYSGYLLQQIYDGDRLRVKKVENSTPTYYLRSTVLGGQIVAELSSAGALARGFVYLGGQLLAVQQNNQVSWVHQDPVVKSKRVTNGAGNVVSTVELDPWGGDTSRSNNETFQPRRFTTYDRDGNASDEAMHRRYNRWHSRFDQPDPYGGSYDQTNPQSFNRYSYVLNDPVNFIDPSGLDDEEPPPGPLDTVIVNHSEQLGGVRGFTGTEGTGILVEDPPTDSGGGGSNPGPDPQDTSQPPQELSDCVKNLLAKYFDRSQLDAIRVHTNGLPWFVPRDKSAYTSSNHVYYAQGQYDPHSAGGIAVIGHEVVHAQQYSKSGNLRFQAKYLFSSAVAGIGVTVGSRGSVMPKFDTTKAYYGNKYEKEADRREREIRDDLVKQFGGINPCP